MSGINQFGIPVVEQQVSAQDQISENSPEAPGDTSGATEAQPGTRTQAPLLFRLLSDAANRASVRETNTRRDDLTTLHNLMLISCLVTAIGTIRLVMMNANDAKVPVSDAVLPQLPVKDGE